jgi:hypothetical protein
MSSNKKTRRHIRRLAERKGMEYREAVSLFYGKELGEINRSLLYSLHKNTKAGRISISPRAGYDRGDGRSG